MARRGMKLIGGCALAFAAAAIFAPSQVNASVILAHWNFEQSQPTSAGNHFAEFGDRNTVSHLHRFHQGTSPSFSSPTGSNGSTNAFMSSAWNSGHYIEFRTDTTGFETITIQWDQTRSSNGPSSFQLQWSLDGVNFTALHSYTVTTSWQTFGAIASPGDLDDAGMVYFRLVNVGGNSPGGHTTSFDEIMISGMAIPAPGALALLGIAGLVSFGRRRRK